MTRTPRITITLPIKDHEKLDVIVSSIGLSSSGQLLRMLLSGDEKRINWICEELKKKETE